MRMEKEIEPRSKVEVLAQQVVGADCFRAFGSLAEKVADYEALLRELSLRVSEEDAHRIKTLLEKVSRKTPLLLSVGATSNLPSGCRGWQWGLSWSS